jgi:CheY-like chemotaxis protein
LDQTSSSTILVVEDETLTRLMLVTELEGNGHSVIEAADADQALSILRNDASIGLLFTDINMPGTIDGLALAKLARAEHPGIRIIFASGHVGLPDWAREADAAFPKPFDLGRVVASINQLLR